jgi:hypothetical protein
MPQRLALAAAALAAAVVLTIGLVAAGFAPTSSGQPVSASLTQATADEALAEPRLEPEIVYVRPAATPRTIVLEKQAPAARSGSSGTATASVSSSRRERDDDDRYERDERDDDERDERDEDERERDDD